jgi:hypothetical protein
MPSVECRENCETSENYQLNVARHAFSCSMRFGPIGSVLVLLHAWALCRRRVKFWDASVLFDDVRFFNMGTEWGGYHLHLLFKSLLYLLSVLLSWVTLNSHRCLRKRTSVVRRSYFVCPISPLFFLDVVTLMMFPLVTMSQKGPFHLEQRIYGFVLPGLWLSFCVYSFEFLCNW